MQKRVLLLFFLGTLSFWAQENQDQPKEQKKVLRGVVYDAKRNKPLPNTNIINLSSVTGTVSKSDGRFATKVHVNDTLYFSYVGFQSIKIKITHDLLKGNELEINMFEIPVDLEEVQLKPYQLIGVLEVDAKNIPLDPYARIHINGIPQVFEVGSPVSRTYDKPMDAIFHPIDFMYELFGKKPKQLRKLKKLRSEDELREILAKKMNREVLMEYLEMDRAQLNGLLEHCNYSEYFIKRSSDLQVIEAVLECYENYKALKKGSTKREKIME